MTTSPFSDDCVIADRGGIIENKHRIHVAVVDSSGKLLYAVGDPSRVTLIRSAAKPAQAIAILEAGGFDYDDEDVALMCASHNSEDRHLDRARSMLAKTQTVESQLQCGGHPSILPELNRTWIRAGMEPTALNNNCSGKHIGMLAGAKALGARLEDYHLLHNPMQCRVQRVVEDLCRLEPNEVSWGVDGCNLPAPAIPLYAMGQLYASVAAEPAENTGYFGSQRAGILDRIYNSMTTYPDLIAGQERFCTVLMKAFQGNLIGKVGADGCYGIGIRPSKDTEKLGTTKAIGIGVKVEDGNLDILYSAVSEILEQLGIGSADMRRQLEPFHRTKRLNTMNIVIGHVSFAFRVRKVSSEPPQEQRESKADLEVHSNGIKGIA